MGARGLGRALGALALVLGLAAGARDGLDGWIAATEIPVAAPVGTEIVDRDGRLLRAFAVEDGRWRLAPGPVDPDFLRLLIAIEDRRFASHAGIDPLALARAAGQAVLAGRIVSGGSTLTMQVARLLENGPTGSWAGKARQMRVALALERRLGKDEILDLYLRLAPYGGNLEGVRAASLAYFGHEPAHLTPAEAALLVALPQAPEARRPDRAPAAARAARDRILARAAALGVIAPAYAEHPEPLPRARAEFPALAPQLAARLAAGAAPGARIETTLDADLQAALERLAARAVAGLAGRVSAAIVVADHRSGEILAQVGGADWGDSGRAGYLDLSTAERSPGSTLKPFVYALAFDDGLAHPETLIDDRPTAFGGWRPQNFDHIFRGRVSLRAALQASLNIPAVALTEAVGPARLMATLNRAEAGLRVPQGAPGLAIVLGGAGISLRGLTQAYAGLARLGRPIRLSVHPGQAQPLPGRMFGAVAAWQVGHVLAEAVPPGGGPRGQIAWKTGTSYGHRDALALGYDGAHVAGVWLGRPDGTPVPGAFGAGLAAPILFEVFGRLGARVALPPPPPATLMLDNAHLPQPLRQFRGREAAFARTDPAGPQMAFPPPGARIAARGGLGVRITGGTAPFTWLANGAPVAVAERRREVILPLAGPGFVQLSVIDAEGRSTRTEVELLP
ncbi:penicillin-binding protein 1C [Phaeovulum vinaykumarii]|uniref:peptidoglycan glycosyltransferase n=1 Tax=Phaeovulum vinaykumarii TaxID=407234 RepID=A0A1N7KYW8_9RHOB|nr:penicillin-binding protein 1C [Phaeovulum vinaykumarii]SIS66785.1 penicillin-binding protein 1C [Phaeovulum vinaykumarii]SOC00971.1 penicillin-binding protein 1C [Phaeovulum vinaykumarii]